MSAPPRTPATVRRKRAITTPLTQGGFAPAMRQSASGAFEPTPAGAKRIAAGMASPHPTLSSGKLAFPGLSDTEKKDANDGVVDPEAKDLSHNNRPEGDPQAMRESYPRTPSVVTTRVPGLPLAYPTFRDDHWTLHEPSFEIEIDHKDLFNPKVTHTDHNIDEGSRSDRQVQHRPTATGPGDRPSCHKRTVSSPSLTTLNRAPTSASTASDHDPLSSHGERGEKEVKSGGTNEQAKTVAQMIQDAEKYATKKHAQLRRHHESEVSDEMYHRSQRDRLLELDISEKRTAAANQESLRMSQLLSRHAQERAKLEAELSIKRVHALTRHEKSSTERRS